MTCKDCIHEKICDHFIPQGLPWGDGQFPAELFCDHFKPKSRYIELPCAVGDTVYITQIDGLDENNAPIFRLVRGRVYKIEIDNTKDTIWIGADFGVLHCCRPYTDFYFTKEEAEAELLKRSKENA